ncbi:hypothetical protein [Streptomyces sp. NPDC058424]|uniref:hypothetical protein n=1 Tax=Streptomyces sp. NPDC058424 TaxID=3346491 RepID=UPI0036560D00
MAQTKFDKQVEESAESIMFGIGRILGGRDLDGVKRTDATFWRSGTRVLPKVEGRVRRRSYKAGWLRLSFRVALGAGVWETGYLVTQDLDAIVQTVQELWDNREQALATLESGGIGAALWAKDLPTVTHRGNVAGIHDALVGLASELKRRILALSSSSGPGPLRVVRVGKEVDRTTCFDVDEHGSVDTTLALGVFVHADHAGCGGGGVRKRSDQPQQSVPADRDLEGIRHEGAGPACERETDRHQRRSQPFSTASEPASEPGDLPGEGLSRLFTPLCKR